MKEGKHYAITLHHRRSGRAEEERIQYVQNQKRKADWGIHVAENPAGLACIVEEHRNALRLVALSAGRYYQI